MTFQEKDGPLIRRTIGNNFTRNSSSAMSFLKIVRGGLFFKKIVRMKVIVRRS